MKRKTLKIICSTLVLGMVAGAFVGCGASEEEGGQSEEGGKIAISGSTSVGPLMEKISEAYESKNPVVTIEINQVGSSAGIKDTINKVSEIGMASRELKDEEKNEVKDTVIAYDGIAVVTNIKNPIKNITMDQIRDIYTGKITNWKEIEGGKDGQIVVASREDGSGTRDAFQEIVGYTSEELTKDAMIANGNGGLKELVVGNENAIAFVSFEYLDDAVNSVNVEGVEPKAELVKSGEYQISRPFILVNREDAITENGQKLIDYILSEEGQQIVKDNKLIPLN